MFNNTRLGCANLYTVGKCVAIQGGEIFIDTRWGSVINNTRWGSVYYCCTSCSTCFLPHCETWNIDKIVNVYSIFSLIY